MRNLENNIKNLMQYISEFNAKNGYLPSIREMASHLSIKSTSTINYYLNVLEQRGLIKRNQQNRARAFEIVKQDDFAGFNAYYSPEYMQNITNIPLVGNVTAGMPILAVENIEGQFGFPEDMFGSGDLFMLNVTGESMINAGIYNNDIVVVHKQSNAVNGEIVVALIDDCATVKRFYKEAHRIRLQPENPTMQPIYADDVTILGKVVGLVRKMKY